MLLEYAELLMEPYAEHFYHTQSVFQVIWQKSPPPQFRQLIPFCY
jgi:hypothetical protein